MPNSETKNFSQNVSSSYHLEEFLRFKKYKDSWKKEILKNLGYFVGGGTPSKDIKCYWQGTIPWISSSDLMEDDINSINITRYITPEALDNSATKLCPQNSINIVSRVGVGKVALSSIPLCTSQDFTNFINKTTNHNKFLAYYLLKIMKQKALKTQGTSIKGITSEEIKKLQIYLPCYEEQKKISDFLSLIDKRIEKQRRFVELLKKYKRGLLSAIFSQKLRFKGYNDEWKKVKIGEIYKERSEKGNTNAELLSVTMNDGVKRRIDIKGRDISSEDKSNYKSVYVGDMVYNSMRMWQGANGISNYNGIVSPAYTVMFPKTKLCDNFIGYLFKYEPLIFLFKRYSQGLTSDTWNLKYPQIKQLSISIPTIPEQEKIASFLYNIDKNIDQKIKYLNKLEFTKKGLLQQMFI